MVTAIWIIWHLLGVIGFVLYCMNPNIRPKKIHLLLVAFCTHAIFVLMGLFYGSVCFAGRKNVEIVE